MKKELGKNFTEFFFEIFLKSPVSRIVPKNVKGDPLGFFERPIRCKISKKLKGGPLENPLETLKKFAKKVSKQKLHAQKNWSRLEPTSFCLADIKIYPN